MGSNFEKQCSQNDKTTIFPKFRTLNWKIGTYTWIVSACIAGIQIGISAFIKIIAPSIGVHVISLITNTFRTIWSVITSDFVSFHKSTWIIGAEIIRNTSSSAIGTGSFLANTFKTAIVIYATSWVAIFNTTGIEKTFININAMEIRFSSEWSDGLFTVYISYYYFLTHTNIRNDK